MTGAFEIFFSYLFGVSSPSLAANEKTCFLTDTPLLAAGSFIAHEDEELMNDVRRQLIVYERNGQILKWHDRMIPAGAEWRDQIDNRIETARIVLLFMSPHFIESQYCYEVEGQAALQRQKTGKAKVIPIILRPCAWEATPFGELQTLPADGKPISRSGDRDETCLNVARGIMGIVDELAEIPEESVSEIAPLVSCNADHSTQPIGMPETDDGAKLIYCSRCGHLAGKKSTCTAGYTHHSLNSGATRDYCARCGVSPGNQTTCTGGYTHHVFVINESTSVHCVRCGVSAGVQSTCTGGYTDHLFKRL